MESASKSMSRNVTFIKLFSRHIFKNHCPFFGNLIGFGYYTDFPEHNKYGQLHGKIFKVHTALPA